MDISYPVPEPIIARTIVLTSDDRGHAIQTAARALGFPRSAYVNQIHSGTAIHVPPLPGEPPHADAIFCTGTGVLIGVFTADCVPVLLYRPEAVGVIHAGWRGFLRGIFEAWFATAGLEPDTFRAIIGPAICADCYEVGMDVARKFPEEHVSQGRPGHAHLDLRTAARDLLIRTGLHPDSIMTHPACTCCTPSLHSYRRNRTPLRNLSVIGIRAPSD